jgi:hypothetical protein
MPGISIVWSGSAMRLLEIEDEPRLGQLIVSTLAQAGFAVDWSQSMAEAKEFVAASLSNPLCLARRSRRRTQAAFSSRALCTQAPLAFWACRSCDCGSL